MLGALRALLPSAASAQQPPPPISLWSFDETSGSSFADIGAANVPMTMVGTWPDLTTGSLVQGVAGTSAYTDGSAYATIPANDPDHNLSVLTISFYYQRNSAAAKHVLLAAGDGSQAGDFSLEVLANGKLRGYHVGQDAQLRFFEATNGITDTNLQVGTAYRIDLTLGPLGARIYVDGDPKENAAILANTNGWNNTRVKHLGVFTDAVGGHADGAFDRLRVWDQQLSNAQIAALEPAQSVTLPAAPQQGADELSVPSLAQWLVCDESNPTSTKFVSNQNRGNGSGSSPGNAQELQAALNGAAPGQTFLAVCQTPGSIEFWNYPNGLTFPSGSAGNYITLQARQGDGVVISRAEDFAGARTPNSGFWTQSGLSADDISKKIWRSVVSFPGGEQNMMGFWIEFDHPHQLLRAGSLTNLRATYGTADSPTNYAGPMVHKDSSGTVWIRMQRPHPDKYSAGDKWSSTTWPGNPAAISGGQLAYPVTENPNSYPIHLFRVNTSITGFNPGNSGQYIKIGAGINSLGFQTVITGTHTWMDRGTHLTWRFIMFSNTGNVRSDMFFNRCRFSDGSKLHLCRAEWKFGGWLEGIRSSSFTMANSDTMDNIYWKDCTIADFHEIFTGVNRANRIRWRNCTFFNIVDDGIQANQNMNRVEIGYCYYRSAAYGGMGVAGTEGDATVPGEWFMHHNVLDYRFEHGSDWRTQPHPGYPYLPHSPDGRSPLKIYNNLFLFGPDCEEEMGVCLQHCPTISDNTLTGAANMHEAFNNILLRVFVEGTKRYDPTFTSTGTGSGYSNSLTNQSDYVNGGPAFVRYSAAFSNELFDFNLYWRPTGMTTDAMFRNYVRGRNQTSRDFASLADWKAHGEFAHSKLSGAFRGAYAPGFDGNSTDTKPTLPAIDNYPADRFKYRPSPTSAVTIAAGGSLSGTGWWTTPPSWGSAYFAWNDGEMTLTPSPWKGALNPTGSTTPIGVQNP